MRFVWQMTLPPAPPRFAPPEAGRPRVSHLASPSPCGCPVARPSPRSRDSVSRIIQAKRHDSSISRGFSLDSERLSCLKLGIAISGIRARLHPDFGGQAGSWNERPPRKACEVANGDEERCLGNDE